MRAALLLLVLAMPAAGCSSHESFCELGKVTCVETCDGEPFLQCGTCPEGSMPLEDCTADGGI